MLARNGCTENPVNCCCVESSSIRGETKRKVTSRKMGPQRRLELVGGWSQLVPLCLPLAGGGFQQVVRVGPLWPSSCMSLYPPLQSMLCRVKSMRLGQLGNGPLSPVSGQFCESNNTSVEIKVLLHHTHIKWTEDLMEVSNSIQTQVRVVRTAPGQGSGQLAGLSFAEFHLD